MLDVEQTVLGKPVEVVSDQARPQLEGVSGLRARHPAPATDDEEVQITADRITQGSQAIECRAGV